MHLLSVLLQRAACAIDRCLSDLLSALLLSRLPTWGGDLLSALLLSCLPNKYVHIIPILGTLLQRIQVFSRHGFPSILPKFEVVR